MGDRGERAKIVAVADNSDCGRHYRCRVGRAFGCLTLGRNVRNASTIAVSPTTSGFFSNRRGGRHNGTGENLRNLDE